MPPSSGWTGTIPVVFSSRSATCRRPRLRRATIPNWSRPPWRRDPSKIASGEPGAVQFKPYASIGTNLLFFEKGPPTTETWFWEHRVPAGQKAYSMTKPIRLEHFADCAAWWGGPAREGRAEGPQAWRVTAAEVKARGYNLDIKNPNTVAADHGDPETLLAELDAAEAEAARIRDQLKAILAEALAR